MAGILLIAYTLVAIGVMLGAVAFAARKNSSETYYSLAVISSAFLAAGIVLMLFFLSRIA